MENPRLNPVQLEKAKILLQKIRKEITKLSRGDANLIFAYKKKIRKELTYDERGNPAHRRNLKEQMWLKQQGFCAICKKKLTLKYSELDRHYAPRGYVENNNVRLVHHQCHIKDQKKKGYK